MQVLLVLTAAASFAAAVALPLLHPLPSAAHTHLALAVGAMPLIFGAMLHFVPVLTRSAIAPPGARLMPLFMLAAGVQTFLSFAVSSGNHYSAAGIALAVSVAFAAWIARRAAASIGGSHPCLYWYLGAIACLILALVAVAAMALWPEQYSVLKRVHLHLNTVGFIGLAAVGTLQVLLPTVAGRPDPAAATRLHRDLIWALAGTLLIAFGSAWFQPLAYVGALLWAIPLAHLGSAWLSLYARELLRLHGAAPSLAAALAGFVVTLLFGVLHANGILSAADTAHAFILAFLFPLVTGAVSQLFPVWAHPGVQTAWHARVRERLGAAGGIRGFLFLEGGILLGLGWRGGMALSVVALAAFLLQLALLPRFRP